MVMALFDWDNIPVYSRLLSSFSLFKNALFSYLNPKLIAVYIRLLIVAKINSRESDFKLKINSYSQRFLPLY